MAKEIKFNEDARRALERGVNTLADAVKLMASGGIKNKNLTPLMTDKHLTDAEQADIVAFLGGLDCGKSLDQPTLP